MANLLTQAEAKDRLGITGTDKDILITALLPGVSRMIERYTGREFTLVAGTASDRTYWYAGGGVLEIGDCTTVVSVTAEDQLLSTDAWIAQPQDALEPVYYWLELATLGSVSPEMGFTRNLDRLFPRYRAGRRQVSVTVNATWGYPPGGIPEDIKLAAAWLISEGLDRSPHGTGVSAESIAEYSISFAQGQGAQGALPSRVTDVLDSWRRTNI